MKIEVYDEDTIIDDLIGDTLYFLDEIKRKEKLHEAVKIAYKGKEAGTIK